MSNDRPESGRARFLEALEVRKHAIRGFGFGVVFTALIYVLFVGLRGGTGLGDAIWYAGLGISLAIAVGALVTTVLVAIRAHRMARDL